MDDRRSKLVEDLSVHTKYIPEHWPGISFNHSRNGSVNIFMISVYSAVCKIQA